MSQSILWHLMALTCGLQERFEREPAIQMPPRQARNAEAAARIGADRIAKKRDAFYRRNPHLVPPNSEIDGRGLPVDRLSQPKKEAP